jgi:hypothetical protein
MSLEQVQRWVGSTFAVTSGFHVAAGIAVAAVMLDRPGTGGRIVLLFLAALSGLLSIGGGLAIHRHKLLTPWLLIGTIPALVGAYSIFWSH